MNRRKHSYRVGNMILNGLTASEVKKLHKIMNPVYVPTPHIITIDEYIEHFKPRMRFWTSKHGAPMIDVEIDHDVWSNDRHDWSRDSASLYSKRLVNLRSELGLAGFAEQIAAANARALPWFFSGGYEMMASKTITFTHYIDKSTIILVTPNVQETNHLCGLSLVADDGKVYPIKRWQVIKCKIAGNEAPMYAVKLFRCLFEEYTKGMEYSRPDVFDTLLHIAKEQDEANMPIELE